MCLPEIEKAVCTCSRAPIVCFLVRSVNLLAFPCKMNCLLSGLSGEQERMLWHLLKKRRKKKNSPDLTAFLITACVPASSVPVEGSFLQSVPNLRC